MEHLTAVRSKLQDMLNNLKMVPCLPGATSLSLPYLGPCQIHLPPNLPPNHKMILKRILAAQNKVWGSGGTEMKLSLVSVAKLPRHEMEQVVWTLDNDLCRNFQIGLNITISDD